MRRFVLGLAGFFGTLAILIVLKAPGGAWQLPPAAVATSAEPTDPGAAPVRLVEQGTFTGTTQYTAYGQVSLAIVVRDASIVDIIHVDLSASEPRSVLLSNRAAPILRARALAAHSADIDNVSGATFTSLAYRRCLQSAIDAATMA